MITKKYLKTLSPPLLLQGDESIYSTRFHMERKGMQDPPLPWQKYIEPQGFSLCINKPVSAFCAFCALLLCYNPSQSIFFFFLGAFHLILPYSIELDFSHTSSLLFG